MYIYAKSKLTYDRRSFGQSVLVSGHHLRPATNLSFSSTEIIFRHIKLFVWDALSDERMICNLLKQLLLGLASAGISLQRASVASYS
jgi:hypothetical protein